ALRVGRPTAGRQRLTPPYPAVWHQFPVPCYKIAGFPVRIDAAMRLMLLPRLAAVGLLMSLAACGGDKNQAYIEKPVDDLYNKAMDNMVEENYAAAAKTFDQVESQHPYSVWATKSQLMQVYALYEDNKYDEAIIAADRFIQLHPGHRDVAYAY